MYNLLRLLALWLCKPIYKSIKNLYEIFYSLSTARFLQSSVIEKFSANIYVIVSVVMLFAFSATILSAIVNPNLMDDKKKGVGAVFKRAIIGLALMVVIPFAFDEAYKIQSSIMCSSTIEKIIVGVNIGSTSKGQDDDGVEVCDRVGGNGGQVIAGTLMASVLYPKGETGESVNIQALVGDDVYEAYRYMIQDDIREGIDLVGEYINSPSEDGKYKHAFEFEGLIAIIAGLATAYILLLFSIDMAIRMFKIAFFELTAPVSIVAYIAAGGDVLKNWFSELLKTYLDVFIRVAAMAFYLFLISNLNDFLSNFSSSNDSYSQVTWVLLLKVLLIIGMLIFIKQVPDLINKVFKTGIKSGGGIGSKLGEMAGIGKQAQKAWGTLTSAAGRVAGKVAIGGAALGYGAAFGLPAAAGLFGGAWAAKREWNNGLFGTRAIKDTGFGKELRKTGAWLKDGKKGLDEFNKNDPDYQAKEQYKEYIKQQKKSTEIKDNAKQNAQGILNSISGKSYYTTGADGKTKFNSDEVIKDNNFNTLFSESLKKSNLSKSEQEKLIDFNNKRNEKNIAENRVKHYDKAQERMSDALSATNDQASKTGIQELKSKMEAGTSYAKVKKAIDEISSMKKSTTIRVSDDDSTGNIKVDRSNPKFGELMAGLYRAGTGKGSSELLQLRAKLDNEEKVNRDEIKNELEKIYNVSSPSDKKNIDYIMGDLDALIENSKIEKISSELTDTANNILKSFESAARISDDDASSILEEYKSKVKEETQEKLDEMFTKIRNTGGLVDMESIKAELENIEFKGSEDSGKLFDKIAENLKIDSEEKLNTVLTAKTAAFDKAEKEKDAMLEKMDSDKRKEEFKAMDAIGKDIGKTKIR